MTHTPGRDEQGIYWFDCGCRINGLMSVRCPLHEAAPKLLAALAQIDGLGCQRSDGVDGYKHTLTAIVHVARAAIAKAEG